MENRNIEEYITRSTGELVEGIVVDIKTLEKDAKQKAKWNQIFKAKKTETPFTFYLMETVKELIKEFQNDPDSKGTYLGYILILNTYLNYENELFLNDNAKKPLNRTGIKDVLGIKCKTASKQFIDYSLDKGILKEVKTSKGKGFAMNDKYTIRGETKDPHKLRMYNKEIRQMAEEYSAEDLSFLYSLTPFIDYHFNSVCLNPYETDPALIDTASIADIMDMTGLSRRSVFYKLNNLKINSEPAFVTVRSGGAYFVIANPDILSRNYFEDGDKIKSLFKFPVLQKN